MHVKDSASADHRWISTFLHERWGSSMMVVHGETVDLLELPALIAGERKGLATYRVRGGEADLLSLDAVQTGAGIGTALLTALAGRLRVAGVARLWVTTTNDNLDALRFYQRRGFRLWRVHPGAVDEARLIKPAIPVVGKYGISIRDELELCLDL